MDARKGAGHEIEKNSVPEKRVDTLTTNSFNFNSIHLVIVEQLNTSCSQNSAIIPYKIDKDSHGNIMQCPIFTILFPRATNQQLAATRNRNVMLKHTIKEQLCNMASVV